MLTAEELKNLATLARLRVPDAELESLRSDLGAVLEYVKLVEAVPVPEGLEMEHSGYIKNVSREDGIPLPPRTYTEGIIENAPDSEEGYVVVPKVL